MTESNSWSTTTRYIVLILMLGVLIWFGYSARALIGPLAVSALIAYILNPVVVNVSSSSRLSRPWVVLLVYVFFFGGLILAVVLLAPILPQHIYSFADQFQTITVEVEKVLNAPITILNFEIPVDRLMASWPEFSQNLTRPDLIIDLLARTSENLIWILVVLVSTYYLLLDWVKLRDWTLGIIPQKYKYDAVRLYQEVRQVWSLYFRGQLRLMLIIGFITWVAAAFIGLPAAFAFGVLAGVFDIVLSIGPLIVTFIAAIVALFLGSTSLPISNVWFMILVIILFSAIQLIENIWLRPKIMSGSMRIHPAVVFIAIIATLTLAGILSALIIIPLIRSAMVLGRYIYCKILDIPVWAEDIDPADSMGVENSVPAE